MSSVWCRRQYRRDDPVPCDHARPAESRAFGGYHCELIDKPGQLRTFRRSLQKWAAMWWPYTRPVGENTHIDACYLRLVMETKDHEHIRQIRQALTSRGYKIIDQSCTYVPIPEAGEEDV